MSAGLAGFVEYPTQELTSGILPIAALNNLTAVTPPGACIRPGQGFDGFNSATVKDQMVSDKMISNRQAADGKTIGQVKAASAATVSWPPAILMTRQAAGCTWPLKMNVTQQALCSCTGASARCGPTPPTGSPCDLCCHQPRDLILLAAPCAALLQCMYNGANFVGKTWTLRVTLPVYVMAVQSVMGEQRPGPHGVQAGRAWRSSSRGWAWGQQQLWPPPCALCCQRSHSAPSRKQLQPGTSSRHMHLRKDA